MAWRDVFSIFRRRSDTPFSEPDEAEEEDCLNEDEISDGVSAEEEDYVTDFVDQSFSSNRLWTIEVFDPDLSVRISNGGNMMEIMAEAPDLFSIFDNALEAMRTMEETLKILNDQDNGYWIGRVRPIIISGV